MNNSKAGEMNVGMTDASAGPRMRRLPGLLGVLLFIVGLVVLLTRYETHLVGTGVMAPVIRGGETVAVEAGVEVRHGEVVVVRAWDDVMFTVRVIGMGGDKVVCCSAGGLQVNGRKLTETYVTGDTAAFGDFAVTVPPGRIFVMSDARSVSVDSRSHLDEDSGTIAADRVVGSVDAVVWPLWRIRPLALGVSSMWLLSGALLSLTGSILLLVGVWPRLRQAGSQISQSGFGPGRSRH